MIFLNNYISIKEKFDQINLKSNCTFIVVSKNQNFIKIKEIIDRGHIDFGENRVLETKNKWEIFLQNHPKKVRLHLIGKLQTNKAKEAVRIFDYIHTLDSIKLAKELNAEQNKISKSIKYFIQVNLANEQQKSGILKEDLSEFLNFCKTETNLDIIGLMCLPPFGEDSEKYFTELYNLNIRFSLKELSMGMSGDYILAIKKGSTFVRIGSAIFTE
jgi:hypothetical protein